MVLGSLRSAIHKVRVKVDTANINVPDSIYPLVLKHGHYIVDVGEGRSMWEAVTPVVNEDGTITVLANGHVIGHIREYDNIGIMEP